MQLVFLSGKPYFISANYDASKIPNLYLAIVSGLSRTTARNYAYALHRWLCWCEQHRLDWKNVTYQQVLDYKQALCDKSSGRRSIQYFLDRLIFFYRFAMQQGVCFPLKRLKEPHDLLTIRGKAFPKTKKRFSVEEIGNFILSFSNPRDRLMAELMFLWGLRRSEVISLPRSLLDLPLVSGFVTLSITGKGGSVREMTLNQEMFDDLAAYAETTSGPFIFSHRGRQMHPDTVNKVFQKNALRTGMNIHPHLLRRMYATHRLFDLEGTVECPGMGVTTSLMTLQSEMGHRHSSTTEKYIHILKSQEASSTLAVWHKTTIAQLRGGVR